ncbi:Iron(II)-dependent oxidoreductase EgtB [Thalassoglobus neptunius]|uniref:Iron(II)-dependent oxidoreductase EgtB n=1 Tax=Thalassoglobus neptunius TaxID=1938619 RepID=A0A5C5WXD5_9PLAN|nr:ergothioneine biosynthesis protein EgtB [Thalassoglobus neptunius]TWT55386.1 Iron(II)-dependent oxidoreductase EgtB [Thalassoglobus neptunius]
MNNSTKTIGSVVDRLMAVRQFSMKIIDPLETEDFVIQTMPDVSPTKWHLAHTTWFFEQFILMPSMPGYRVFHPQFSFLFNSYYNAVGERHPRMHRGVLSRPTVREVLEYRSYVDQALKSFLQQPPSKDVGELIEIGIHHEQQHQELMLTDIKHVLSCNPLRPAYRVNLNEYKANDAVPLNWISFAGGIAEIGAEPGSFHFDNESPRHEVLNRDFELASRLTTNGEYLEFVQSDGYQNPSLWLSEGWDQVQACQWKAPLYWELIDGEWQEFTLGGMRPLDPNAPVTHVSYFEADAFARWSNCRLATEAEWETVGQSESHAHSTTIPGNFAEDDYLHPVAVNSESLNREQTVNGIHQLYGDAWEWTASPYVAYPGYQPAPGAIGEYNGKFMSSQWVLKGGSCATSRMHIRPSYRNFFHPDKRWQFTGFRLAK